jgi:uncharacterized C2H2 Zn-finger protein
MKRTTCPECGKTFNSKSKLKRNVISVIPENRNELCFVKYACPHCGKEWKSDVNEIKTKNMNEKQIIEKAEELYPEYPDGDAHCTEHDPNLEMKQECFIRGANWMLEKLSAPPVTCRCGALIQHADIDKWNGCNDEGEEYGEVFARCNKCGAEYKAGKWGTWDSLEQAKKNTAKTH